LNLNEQRASSRSCGQPLRSIAERLLPITSFSLVDERPLLAKPDIPIGAASAVIDPKRSYEMCVNELYREFPAHFMPMTIECSLVNFSTRMS
jgi:hypothetical protein